ncbi:hypothetical protein D3C87_1439720 [compost metagenome]
MPGVLAAVSVLVVVLDGGAGLNEKETADLFRAALSSWYLLCVTSAISLLKERSFMSALAFMSASPDVKFTLLLSSFASSTWYLLLVRSTNSRVTARLFKSTIALVLERRSSKPILMLLKVKSCISTSGSLPDSVLAVSILLSRWAFSCVSGFCCRYFTEVFFKDRLLIT